MRKNLRICSWNVGGLVSEDYDKSKDPAFISQIANYDLVLLTETHIGYDSQIQFDNFLFYPFCREK